MNRWQELGTRRSFLAELFITVNLAFLSFDIVLAHSVNRFAHPAEWVPFGFTLAGAAALGANLAMSGPVRRGSDRGFREGAGWWTGVAVGVMAIVVGVTGLLLHLQSDFFEVMTLRALVYSAPFVAPLAFTGLGLLTLLNRLVEPETPEWGQWVVILAWGGFLGNFVLSLVDHAQNGFFYATEWVPVVVAGLVVGWLAVPAFLRAPSAFIRLGLAILGVAALTGVAGFVLHLAPALSETTGTLADRVVYGAPLFAPLLFPNLALLGALGLWDLLAKGWVASEADDPDADVAEAGASG